MRGLESCYRCGRSCQGRPGFREWSHKNRVSPPSGLQSLTQDPKKRHRSVADAPIRRDNTGRSEATPPRPRVSPAPDKGCTFDGNMRPSRARMLTAGAEVFTENLPPGSLLGLATCQGRSRLRRLPAASLDTSQGITARACNRGQGRPDEKVIFLRLRA